MWRWEQQISSGSEGFIERKIDRNLPKLQETCGHVFAVCVALLDHFGAGLLSTKAGRRVGSGRVAFGGERGSVRASVGSRGLEAIGLGTLVRAGVHGEIYRNGRVYAQ